MTAKQAAQQPEKSDYQKVLDVIRYDDKPHATENNSVAATMRRKEKADGKTGAPEVTAHDAPEQFEEIDSPPISMWPPVSGEESQGAVTEDGEWHSGQPEFGEEGGPIEPPPEPPPTGGNGGNGGGTPGIDPPPPDMQSFSTTFKQERKE